MTLKDERYFIESVELMTGKHRYISLNSWASPQGASRPGISSGMRSRTLAAGLALLGFLLAGCGKKPKVRVPIAPVIGATEEGIASWYGHPYHGRRAANGEIYDMEKLTAAHRTLPFGTWVRVENLSNNRTVTVRINDRGPFVDGRIIDLSRAAAREIDMIGPGTAKVRLVVTARPQDAPAEDVYQVQVGAFREKKRAEKVRGEMRRRYKFAELAVREGEPPLWRVLVGEKVGIDEANELARKLRAEYGAAFVVRVDDAPAK
jgi:rare lipoprotein A